MVFGLAECYFNTSSRSIRSPSGIAGDNIISVFHRRICMRLHYRLLSILVMGIYMLVLFSGCAKVPDQELAAAKAAIKAAQSVEADKYMPNNFKNIQKAMTAAETEIGMQNIKFVLSRNYGKAKGLLKNATDLAKQVESEAPETKVKIKMQVEAGIASAQRMAKETRVDIKNARRSKEKQVLAQMKTDLNTAENGLTQAASDFASGDIIGARTKLSGAQRLLKGIFDKLSTDGTDGLM